MYSLVQDDDADVDYIYSVIWNSDRVYLFEIIRSSIHDGT